MVRVLQKAAEREKEMKTLRLILEACLPPGAMGKVTRNRLLGKICLPLRALMLSWQGHCQGLCLSPWSYSSQGQCCMAPLAIEDCADFRGLGHHLGLCWDLRAMLP